MAEVGFGTADRAGPSGDTTLDPASDTATDVINLNALAAVGFTAQRWLFELGYQHTFRSIIDGNPNADSLDDASSTIGAKIQYSVGELIFLSLRVRHMVALGDYHPYHSPGAWQFNKLYNLNITDNSTRIYLSLLGLFP